jgi:hypothetical protein
VCVLLLPLDVVVLQETPSYGDPCEGKKYKKDRGCKLIIESLERG